MKFKDEEIHIYHLNQNYTIIFDAHENCNNSYKSIKEHSQQIVIKYTTLFILEDFLKTHF